jgi:hypothetical protein
MKNELIVPSQDKTQQFCFLYAFEMTGILDHGREGTSKTQYSSVFPSHTTDTFVWVFIE